MPLYDWSHPESTLPPARVYSRARRREVTQDVLWVDTDRKEICVVVGKTRQGDLRCEVWQGEFDVFFEGSPLPSPAASAQ